jgi:predicted Holliday junction resolvase-like endonuclease|tara:strand:+ start:112 stop:327 length:216 start_codon:yes stop_codon:yes gene_type:complete
MAKMITSFIPVFEDKVVKLKEDLKKELKKSKIDRRKDVMESLVKEAKGLQKTIKEVKEQTSQKCPHCGGVL